MHCVLYVEEDYAMIATCEKIRCEQERLNATLEAAVETIRQTFLDGGAAIIEAQRVMKQDLSERIRQGLEREAFLSILSTVRAQAERVARLFRRVFVILEGDAVAMPALELRLREAEEFLTWLRGLECRVSATIPPFDESELLPAPNSPTANGYVSVSEARARVRAGKRP
jgi:hypothetical protein